MTSTPIVAVDPGKHGGIAASFPVGAEAIPITMSKMPDTEQDIKRFLFCISRIGSAVGGQVLFVIEEPPISMGRQVSASAIAKLHRQFGFLLGVASSLGWKIERVKPQTWQKALSLGTKGDMTQTQWKNKLKARAQELYPALADKITLATADALLILEYARRIA